MLIKLLTTTNIALLLSSSILAGTPAQASAVANVNVTVSFGTATACSPQPGAVIEAGNPDTGTPVASVAVKPDCTAALPLEAGTYNITVWAPGYQALTLTSVKVAAAPLVESVHLNRGNAGGEFYRIILGVQQAGASSTSPTRKLFGDFWLDVPGPGRKEGSDLLFGPKLRFWGDVRATSIPEVAPVQLSQINLGSQASKLNTSELVQSIAFMWGAERRIFEQPRSVVDAPDVGLNNNKSDNSDVERFTLSAFAGVGAVTPDNPQQSATLVNGAVGGAAQLYKDITGNTFTCPPAPAGGGAAPACVLALLSKDRSRFMKEWFVGARLKTHYFTQAGIPAVRPPAVLDIGIGQNANVTGGTLHGCVIRLEAFYPLPYQQLKMVYLFGRADLQLGGKDILSNPYILAPDTSGATITTPHVQTLTLPLPNRDNYQIGIGVDLLPLVSKLMAK
jgi:hypothetical protein